VYLCCFVLFVHECMSYVRMYVLVFCSGWGLVCGCQENMIALEWALKNGHKLAAARLHDAVSKVCVCRACIVVYLLVEFFDL